MKKAEAIETSQDMQLVPYSLETAVVEGLKGKYMDVVVLPDDKATYAMAMAGLRECREIRLSVDAWHKERKELIVKAGKHYDSERRRVHALIAPVEDHLRVTRQTEDNRKAAIEKARVDGIRAKIDAMRPPSLVVLQNAKADDLHKMADATLATPITKEVFMEFFDEAVTARKNAFQALCDAEQARRTWEAEAAERKVEAERLEKQKAEQDAEAKRLADEKTKLEADKKVAQEEKDRAEFEKQAEERAIRDAREQVVREEVARKAKEEAEAKAKADREAQEAAEKVRAEAKRPDKEKITAYGEALRAVPYPQFTNEDSRKIINEATFRLLAVIEYMKVETEAL